MCVVARYKQFIQSVCIIRKISPCACDNRADHVACGSRFAREVSMSCKSKLSYLVYLIHSDHPTHLVVLDGGLVFCADLCTGPFVIVLHVSRRSRSHRDQCSVLLPKSSDSLVFPSLARVTRSAQVAHCSCLVQFDQFTQLLWF